MILKLIESSGIHKSSSFLWLTSLSEDALDEILDSQMTLVKLGRGKLFLVQKKIQQQLVLMKLKTRLLWLNKRSGTGRSSLSRPMHQSF